MKRQKKLTPKMKRFADEYLVDLNATQAYKRAGFKSKNDAVAAQSASRLLRNIKVSACIQEKIKEIAKSKEITVAGVLEETRRIAFSDARKLFNGNGDLKDVSALDDVAAASIASVEVAEEFRGKGEDREHVGYTKKVKLWDKNSALDKLFKYLALYKEPGSQDNPIQHRVVVEFKNAD